MQMAPFPPLITDPKFDISVVLPTRGRTDALLRSITSLLDNADDPKRILLMFGFDDDDTSSIEYFKENVIPYIQSKGAATAGKIYKRMGYTRLNEYVNDLSVWSDAKWCFFWGDDALMQTKGWDTEIMKFDGHFKLLSVHTHHDHPYSIFPIIPKEWVNVLGHFSPHQLSDSWVSEIGYVLGIFERIPVWVIHDRFDLTGNNNDETFNNRPYFTGNRQDSRDVNHPEWVRKRWMEADKLAWFMKVKGMDISYWEGVRAGTKNPWLKLKENDTNNQVYILSTDTPNK